MAWRQSTKAVSYSPISHSRKEASMRLYACQPPSCDSTFSGRTSSISSHNCFLYTRKILTFASGKSFRKSSSSFAISYASISRNASNSHPNRVSFSRRRMSRTSPSGSCLMTRYNEAGERYRFMPPFSIKAILLYLVYSPCHTLKNPILLSIFSALSETRPSSE